MERTDRTGIAQAEGLARECRERYEGIARKVEQAERGIPFEDLLEPGSELGELLTEGRALVAEAGRLAAEAERAFLDFYRALGREARLRYYADRHGLRIRGTKLVGITKRRRSWPESGTVDDQAFVGSRALWKKRPLYWSMPGPDEFIEVEVLEGEPPEDPDDFFTARRFEIIRKGGSMVTVAVMVIVLVVGNALYQIALGI